MENQFDKWENEYRNPVFLTKDEKPQSDTVKFFRFLKKNKIDLNNKTLMDIGSGTGRNGNFFAEKGVIVTGIELSKTAVSIANERSRNFNLNAKYILGSIGETFPFENDKFDIALDVMSSNSLSEQEREIFVKELLRVLKKDAFVYIKAHSKDGDKNAKELLKKFPGKEKDTYTMPQTGITERVFTEKDFIDTYTKGFKILKLDKKSNYFGIGDRKYKRNYFVCYMQKIG